MTFFKDLDAVCMRKMGGDIPHDPGPLIRRVDDYMEAFCMDCGKRVRSIYRNVNTISTQRWLALFIVREWP